jgi:hypothetical protein
MHYGLAYNQVKTKRDEQKKLKNVKKIVKNAW